MPKVPSIVLGISFGHGDSSAALIVDGCLIAAAEEERFRRVKHYALFPTESVNYCLKHAQIKPREVQVVAIAHRPRNQWKQQLSLAFRQPSIGFSGGRPIHGEPLKKMLHA
jgi:carbamoyltransferase